MWVPECPWVAPLRQPASTAAVDGVALDEFAGLHVDPVHPQGFGDLLHVGYRGPGAFTGAGAADGAGVGDLPARLGVQRCAVQHEFDLIGAG